MLTLSCCLILASHLAAAIQDDTATVFVRENESTELKWSLFIGENAGRSSVYVMIKKSNVLLCLWGKAHGEVNQCDPGMNLTISPEHVRVPGPTNITVTFSFKNNGRSDDGTYECRLVIDEKWQEMQVYRNYLVTTVEPNVTLNATYSNTCNTNFACHVSGGRPKPKKTFLMKNGEEISRSKLICPEEAGDTDDNGASYCYSIHSVENSGGQIKCSVKHAGHSVDSAEVGIPFRIKENETSAPCNGKNDRVCAASILVYVIAMPVLASIAFVLIVVLVYLCTYIFRVWKRRKHLKTCIPATEKGTCLVDLTSETGKRKKHLALLIWKNIHFAKKQLYNRPSDPH